MAIAAEVIIAGISATLQAAQTWMQYRDQTRASRAFKETYNQELTSPETKLEAQRLSSIVPDDVLDIMEDRARGCWKKFGVVLDDGKYLPPEIDDATAAVLQCLCRELGRIRKLNNGIIPDGKMREWWAAYCEDQKTRSTLVDVTTGTPEKVQAIGGAV